MRRIVAIISVATFSLVTIGPVASSAQAILDCDYFNFQEQAQAILEEDLSDPNFLDEDGDGIACVDLPSAGPDPEFPELPENGDYSCVDFAYQEMAQVILEEDESDPYNLDPTGDGVACSRLPLQAVYALDDEFADEPAGDDREARRAERRAERQSEQAADDEAAAEDEPPADDTAAAEDDREARRAERREARQAEREETQE